MRALETNIHLNVQGIRTRHRGFTKEALVLDAGAEVDRIVKALRKQVLDEFHRRGVVGGLSGGVDSPVVAALCTRALGEATRS